MNMKKVIIILLSVILLVFAITGVAFGIHKWKTKKAQDNNTSTATETTRTTEQTPATNVTPDPIDSLVDLKISLTVDVDRATLDGMYAGYSQEFLDSSMPNRNDERTSAAALVGWGKSGNKMYDAVTFPFSTVEAGKKKYNEDIDQMYAELQEEIMRNPVMGDMVLQGMQYMFLTDNTSIADLNDGWVDDFESTYDTYGIGAFITYHTRYWEKYGFELPHDGEDVNAWREAHPDAPNPTEDDLQLIVDEDNTPTPTTTAYGRQRQSNNTTVRYKLFVTDYYVGTAKRILTFLDRCAIQGVKTYSTARHWPLNSALNANQVRTYMNEDNSYVDKQPALIFCVLTKDGTRQILFGFNIYDMRLEIFERTSTLVTPDPDPTPRPNPDPTPTPDPDPTPRPDPDPTPNPDPTPTPDPDPTPRPDPDPTPTPVPNPTPIPVPNPVPNPIPTPVPNPNPKKDPVDDPVHHGNADTGDGAAGGNTPSVPVPDSSRNDMQNARTGEDHNGGHSDPNTVKPSDPNPSSGNNDVKHTDSNPDDYGEEDHGQHDPVVDGNGGISNPDDQPAGGEFDEPPI